jgi:hypothetical protein
MPYQRVFFTKLEGCEPLRNLLTACSFRWFIVAESIVYWFVVREKHCWMTADLVHKLKRTRQFLSKVSVNN